MTLIRWLAALLSISDITLWIRVGCICQQQAEFFKRKTWLLPNPLSNRKSQKISVQGAIH